MVAIQKRKIGYVVYTLINGVRTTVYVGKGSKMDYVKNVATILGRIKDHLENDKAFSDSFWSMFDELGISLKIRRKLEKKGLLGTPVPHTLGELMNAYTDVRNSRDLSETTMAHDAITMRHLLAFFPEKTDLRNIKFTNIEEWRQYLLRSGFSEATTTLYLRIAGTMWRWAIKKKYLTESPFEGVKYGKMTTKKKFHIDMETYRKLLDQCPSQLWRTLLALCRIGGLRNDSETMALTWEDVLWEKNRMRVYAKKTDTWRETPLFPELRCELEALYNESPTKSGLVLAGLPKKSRQVEVVLKMIENAGLQRWERLFHNMRKSRVDDLIQARGPGLAAQYLGHSPNTALKHYFSPSDDDFRDAANFKTER